ncbi:hypothetical protein ACFRCG_23840 [Embleya sp. NPDC056575]|uniref:hypothetical protein n=1 Tax=unclassified Embleya TaxID=2699296 RepID=UPI0036B5DCFD
MAAEAVRQVEGRQEDRNTRAVLLTGVLMALLSEVEGLPSVFQWRTTPRTPWSEADAVEISGHQTVPVRLALLAEIAGRTGGSVTERPFVGGLGVMVRAEFVRAGVRVDLWTGYEPPRPVTAESAVATPSLGDPS